MKIQLPEKLQSVFQGEARYRGARGGRGSAKSRSFAAMALLKGMEEPMGVLCAREIQNSLKDSVHAELCDLIDELDMGWFYEYGSEYIRSRKNLWTILPSFERGQHTEFSYSGLLRNIQSLKSKSRFKICWVEEAEYVSENSWRKLGPTMRMPGSEIWLTWNPEVKGSATDKRFIQSPPSRAKIVEINWRENPWFTKELEEERQNDLRRDPDAYHHIWEGGYSTRSEAQILRGKWVIENFEVGAGWDGPYDGADWGFSTDPTVRVRLWIHEHKHYIEHEVYGMHTELKDLPELFDKFPMSRKVKIRADNARPETISYMKNGEFGDYEQRTGIYGGFIIEATEKWAGSIEDGIEHLRGAYDKIIIHPRCVKTAEEARLYSYKVDRLTNDVTTDIIDKHNHCIDAIRYALNPMIQRRRGFFS